MDRLVTTLDRDLEIVEDILSEDSNLQVIHQYGHTRLEDDFKEALSGVIEEISEKDQSINQYKEDLSDCKQKESEMVKHINRLEKMLVKRSVNFKSWESVQETL